jgi:hypothetical protein
MLIEAGRQLMSIGNDWGRDVRTLIALGGAALALVPASIATFERPGDLHLG